MQAAPAASVLEFREAKLAVASPEEALSVRLGPAAPRSRIAAATTRTVPHAEGIGTIEIPKIGVRALVREGVDQPTLARGPGHWPGTSMPGGPDNVVIGGHRVTHTRPFLDLDRLQPSDSIFITTDSGRFLYEVRKSFVVDDSEGWIATAMWEPMLTLFTCHPKGSDEQRLVVTARLVLPPAPTPNATASEPAPSPTPVPPESPVLPLPTLPG
jgi:sortase A